MSQDPTSQKLDSAIKNWRAQEVQALLAAGASLSNRNSIGLTPLFQAIQSNNVASLDLLLRFGADVSDTCRFETPAYFAAHLGRAECLRRLAAHGADVGFGMFGGSEAKSASPRQSTCLIGALNSQSPERADVVAVLLEAGADPNTPLAGHGTTPLMIAALFGGASVFDMLLEAGADIRAKTTGASDAGSTVLHFAARGDNVHAISRCVALGLDASVADRNGRGPLHAAARANAAPAARELVSLGADLEARDVDGMTPLMAAFEAKKERVAQALADLGANMEACASSENAPAETLEGLAARILRSIKLGAARPPGGN